MNDFISKKLAEFDRIDITFTENGLTIALTHEAIKDFIRTALQSQKAEILKKFEEKDKEPLHPLFTVAEIKSLIKNL